MEKAKFVGCKSIYLNGFKGFVLENLRATSFLWGILQIFGKGSLMDGEF
jgi:hypothetical protein